MNELQISPRRVDAYLGRLGSPKVSFDLPGLTRLQSAHLHAVPFHNLRLIANDGRDIRLDAIEQVVDEAILGVGGTCDRTTPPFAALLHSLGFDVRLAAASVFRPGDHFVAIVRLGGHEYLVDVGNGHPYLQPWRMDGPEQPLEHLGWRLRFDPDAAEGPSLFRHLDDGRQKRIYTVGREPRSYLDFEPMMRSHYMSEGFGPFMHALRAVRMQPRVISTVRDAVYARHTDFGRGERPIASPEAARTLLVERFALPPALVDEALGVLGKHRPTFFGGLAPIDDAPSKSPDVLVSLATVGRPRSVRRLLKSLAVERQASGYSGQVGVLVLENHLREEGPEEPAPEGISVHRVPVAEVWDALERSARAGIIAAPERAPVSIGAAREAQLEVLHRHLRSPMAGLPHPDRGPTVVWMVDDDLAFEQLGPDGDIGRKTPLLHRVAQLWAKETARSVILGTFCGDPPIPALDSWRGQLADLEASVEVMLAAGPETPWAPPPPPPSTFDAYYDLSEAESDGSRTWPFAPERAGACAREVLAHLLDRIPDLLDGQLLTRALIWDGAEWAPRASSRRGGNTLFLDLDFLFRWPTPELRTCGEVITRRADTLWAILAQAEEPHAVVEAPLPLLHGREGQGPRTRRAAESWGVASHTTGQVRGTALARALSDRRPIAVELRSREARVMRHRVDLLERIEGLKATLRKASSWDAPEITARLDAVQPILEAMATLARRGIPAEGDAAELEAFVSMLPRRVEAWRASR